MPHSHPSPVGDPSTVATYPWSDEIEQIPGLRDWDDSGSDAAARAERRAAARRTRGRQAPTATNPAPPLTARAYLTLYGKYVGLFVGAGLISGAVVHYPLDPRRYLLIGGAGAALFMTASAFHEARARVRTTSGLLRFFAASLTLALGIGMISGGIQHFSDIPGRAATLIPLGGALSLMAFALRDGHRLERGQLQRTGGAMAAALVVLGLLLAQVAGRMDVPAEGGHGHGAPVSAPTAHQSAASEAPHDEAPPAPAANPTAAESHEGHPH